MTGDMEEPIRTVLVEHGRLPVPVHPLDEPYHLYPPALSPPPTTTPPLALAHPLCVAFP